MEDETGSGKKVESDLRKDLDESFMPCVPQSAVYMYSDQPYVD